jgi:hypothetical protein
MELSQSQFESGAALGAMMASGACPKLVAEDNLRTAIGVVALMATGIVTAALCRRPVDGTSFGVLSATLATLHRTWSHFYAPQLPCPAGRLSGRAIGAWTRYIHDCYFPGIWKRLAKVRGAEGETPR